jgi:septin 7
MLSIPISKFFTQLANGFNKGQNRLAGYISNMASVFANLLPQSRMISRSESTSRGPSLPHKVADIVVDLRRHPGSLHRRNNSNSAVPYYCSMLDVDKPSLNPIAIEPEGSMEDWVVEKLSQTTKKHKTENWADILCFYTASNGAPAAPTRAPPGSIPNGKPVEQQIPQSVSSSDPKIAAQQATDMRNIVRRKLTGYVGFANLPNQWHRKSVRKGFNFNVMVVGMLCLSPSFELL